jgi:hypothetical protein
MSARVVRRSIQTGEVNPQQRSSSRRGAFAQPASTSSPKTGSRGPETAGGRRAPSPAPPPRMRNGRRRKSPNHRIFWRKSAEDRDSDLAAGASATPACAGSSRIKSSRELLGTGTRSHLQTAVIRRQGRSSARTFRVSAAPADRPGSRLQHAGRSALIPPEFGRRAADFPLGEARNPQESIRSR